MTVQYGDKTSGTNGIGMVVLTTTTVALALATVSAYRPASLLIGVEKSSIKPVAGFSHHQVREWEASLMGAQSTGGEDVLQRDAADYYRVSHFAQRFISEQSDVPPEFEKTFRENFWDILA
ncbi:hypothetical protein WDW86_02110 [Bdellovibrionota bacterium FG-2]